jgi:outer membrane protein OmpA-like peptidoglycan-associated protein
VDVYYAINSVTITEPQRVKLDSLVTYLKLNPETKVVITGYADRQTGTAAYNLQISRRRADAVYRYLKQKGLGDDRMQVSAMGDKEQPRPTMLENRVVICVVEEKGSK